MANKAMRPASIDRSYKAALEILNGRRRPQRPTVERRSSFADLNRMPDAKGKPELKGTPSIVGMKQCLQNIGYSTADIDKLNVIHVAGTKGKGSTAAFVESLLRSFGARTSFPRKTGLYTSPHLIYPEERIRINFQPIGKDLFAKYFFEVWDALSKSEGAITDTMPRYLQLLLLVSLHAFVREGVEAAVIETHHGGEFDSTNVVENPVATVITALGMDHVKQLGPTIENIAWHKAGIIKAGAFAVSAPQDPIVAKVIRERASTKGVAVQFVHDDSSLSSNAAKLQPQVQRLNCSVALAAVREFLNRKAPSDLSPLSEQDILQGINQFFWPGRFQVVADGAFTWYLDSAHNEMSITKAADWFIQCTQNPNKSSPTRIVIFGQVSDERDGTMVLRGLATSLQNHNISHVIFTRYLPHQSFDNSLPPTSKSPDEAQQAFGQIWAELNPGSTIHYESNIRDALQTVRKTSAEVDASDIQALITGSQHLVGGALFFLDPANTTEPST